MRMLFAIERCRWLLIIDIYVDQQEEGLTAGRNATERAKMIEK